MIRPVAESGASRSVTSPTAATSGPIESNLRLKPRAPRIVTGMPKAKSANWLAARKTPISLLSKSAFLGIERKRDRKRECTDEIHEPGR